MEQANSLDFEPFRGWRTKEFHGKYINVDSWGVRKTWNPRNFQGRQPKTIYLFGGSTAWGFGARDDYTIPSLLSKLLAKKGHSFVVHNYAEVAHTFGQNLLRLALLLREGYQPDYVIFYVGLNDVATAYEFGVAGAVNDFFRIEEILEHHSLSHWQNIWIGVKGLIADRSRIYQAVSRIRNRSLKPGFERWKAEGYTEEQLKKLSGDIRKEYEKSIQFLDHLAKAYSFKYLVFWQPVIYTKKVIHEYEKMEYIPENERTLARLYLLTTDGLGGDGFSQFFNITHILDDKRESYYLDSGHLSEEGNAVAAEKVVDVFEKEFLK
ncbi:MAG: hypothetical protein A2W61_00710 [Deltaproteobacteria bacterium RIFCSPLOWO2_01_44_7]|nr:MAG: hypothetical protein A2W61_00710 [Deltaproteobacteria bacterium RIFCSPLOWO2_01_44_7]